MLQASFRLTQLLLVIAANTLVIQRILLNKEKFTSKRDRNHCLKNFTDRSDCIFPLTYPRIGLNALNSKHEKAIR